MYTLHLKQWLGCDAWQGLEYSYSSTFLLMKSNFNFASKNSFRHSQNVYLSQSTKNNSLNICFNKHLTKLQKGFKNFTTCMLTYDNLTRYMWVGDIITCTPGYTVCATPSYIACSTYRYQYYQKRYCYMQVQDRKYDNDLIFRVQK